MADLDLSGRRLGEFVLHEQIGAGGYGAVYRCEQPVLKRDAVVKVLHTRRRWNHAARERFLREARLASRLEHPYAAHVYSFGAEDDGVLWIAMELVQGITLGDWLKSRGPMPLDQFVAFFECVAQVVQAAHERGIVHRDLKPSNMMVLESGGRLFPKLLDFGIAKLHDEPEEPEDREDEVDEVPVGEFADGTATVRIRISPQRVQRTRTDSKEKAPLTRCGAVIGSAPYMSPEQWGDPRAVGPASDVYSLGCVAYEMLTGGTPFTGTNTEEYYRRHLVAEPPPLGDAFPPGLDRVLRRALAKSPEERHASVLELAAELRAELRAHPREQLRSAAQQWQDRARSPGMLWGRDALAGVDRLLQSDAPGALSDLECSFVVASQRRSRRIGWFRRALVLVAAAGTVGGLQYRSAMQADLAEQRTRLAEQQTRSAQQLAEVRVTQSELEQGRAALLHGEPEAQAHLTEAYKRDAAPSTAFMLARAMQPRLQEEAQFPSTFERMWSAIFSPDGKQIVTTDDRAAQIWDAETHRLLWTLPHGAEVYHALYSPDRQALVTVGRSKVRIWDATRGVLLRDLQARPGVGVPNYFDAAISPDSRFVAAIDFLGGCVHVWSIATGELVAELASHAADYPAIAFGSGGWLAITGGGDVQVYDVRTWAHVLTLPGPARSLAFASRSQLVIGSATGDIAVWQVAGGARLAHLRQFGESVDALAWSSDGRLVAAASRDGLIQVWEVASGRLQSQLNPGHTKIQAIEFDSTATLLLAASADGTVVVADPALGLLLARLDGPRNVMRVAHFDPVGSHVVGASWDGTARLWDARSSYRRWSSDPITEHCGVATTPDIQGRYVAVGCVNRPVRIWDTARGQLLAELPSVSVIADGGFTSPFPAVSVDGDRAAIARANTVEVYGLPDGRLLRTISHNAAVSAVAFAAEGRGLISGAVDGSLIITNDDGTQRGLQTAGGVDAVALLSDGSAIVTDAQRRFRFYSSAGAVVADFETSSRMMSLRRDGVRMVAIPNYVTSTSPPLLLDLDRKRVIAELSGHRGRVFSARWVTEHRIVTAGADGTARLWDGVTGQPLQVYRGGSRYLADAALLSESIVIAGDADGLVRFWDARSGARLWTMQAHKSAVVGVHVEGGDLVTRGFTGELSRWRLPSSEQVIERCSRRPGCAIVAR